MKKKLTVLIMICLSLSLSGQQSMFKALFMFNFAKYIEWPDRSNQNEFIIGVYGNDEIVNELKKLASSKKINNKSIVIKTVKSLSEASDANLFFVPASKSAHIAEVSSFFAQKPTLIVSEKEGGCKDGSAINYVQQGGKMKYEICRSKIESHNLKVDQKLISLGIEVK
ncbi:YfiR family protein [Plebeiibacterium marinum]|uniref:YfiR family protein n=1 Tax=Plebeiibacterium marinum TaxID=2992111 RepID=A0AAE3SLW7_9BACT|nr:YfiR family protein [Plebeiobacterium marinum]MCW3808043.1 YfiR family protein [Plebeiobacterium marinum]